MHPHPQPLGKGLRCRRDRLHVMRRRLRLAASLRRRGLEPLRACAVTGSSVGEALEHALAGNNAAIEIGSEAFAAGGIVGLLKTADRTQRAKLYTELGLSIDYQREAATERIHVRSQLCGGGGKI